MAYKAVKRLHVNREHTSVVPEDHPEGAELLAAEGAPVHPETVKALKLTREHVTQDHGEAPKQQPAIPVTPATTMLPDAGTGLVPTATDTGSAGHSGVTFSAANSGSATTGTHTGADAPAPEITLIPGEPAQTSTEGHTTQHGPTATEAQTKALHNKKDK